MATPAPIPANFPAPLSLPPLPYAEDALEPVISDMTLSFHHDKHHRTYIENANRLIAGTELAELSLERIVTLTAGVPERASIFNNAAQAWNHAFFWPSMAPEASKPSGDLDAAIRASFGGLAQLREAFAKAGVAHFGSGWVWLVADGGKLAVKSTHDAHDIITDGGGFPLLVCDLWEHAYYLDYQNDRKAFLEAWFDALANWSFASSQLAASAGKGDPWCFSAPRATAAAA